jgi:hypothetical protein
VQGVTTTPTPTLASHNLLSSDLEFSCTTRLSLLLECSGIHVTYFF